MAKKEPLVVGQKVWLETTNRHGCDVRYENEPCEMVVLEANKTSVYIWHNDKSKVRYKVNQKTHQVKYSIPDGRSYRLWLSKEEYELNVAYEKEMKELLVLARGKIDSMSLDDLRSFVTA
ncbi:MULTISPECIES: beta barrel domain-containing protein [unclassified Psychrobacillus]|uniref:beta barrel domain-containing protein n=1 Tax=unclassified Psychrobacillus TaxID=2636677 RepID=UPI0030FA383E